MLSFVAIEGKSGIWANRDKALEYFDAGYKVYTADWEEMSRADIERIVECDSTGADSVRDVKGGDKTCWG